MIPLSFFLTFFQDASCICAPVLERTLLGQKRLSYVFSNSTLCHGHGEDFWDHGSWLCTLQLAQAFYSFLLRDLQMSCLTFRDSYHCSLAGSSREDHAPSKKLREDTRKGSPHKPWSDIAMVWKRSWGFIHRLGIFLTFQLQMRGRHCGESKEEQEGRGGLAALPGSHPRLCGGSRGWQPLLLGMQLAPGYAGKSLTTTYFSLLLQGGLTGSTYWDSGRQPKTVTQFHAEVKTCSHQQKRMTFPLKHHLDLCLWPATIFSFFFFSLTMTQNRVGQT